MTTSCVHCGAAHTVAELTPRTLTLFANGDGTHRALFLCRGCVNEVVGGAPHGH